MSWLNSILGRFGFKNLFKDRWIRMDFRKASPDSIQEFLEKNTQQARELQMQGKLPKYSGTADQNILKILTWVHRNIVYEVDKKRFNTVEKWQTVEETLAYGKGDCEDGAILIYCLARVHNISSYAIRLTCGDVKSGNKTEGHCWVTYYPDEFLAIEPCTIDWCYWYNSKPFKGRTKYDRKLYISEWFSITYL